MFEEPMSDDPERSPSGSPILRHKEREPSFEPAVGGGDHAEAVERHFELLPERSLELNEGFEALLHELDRADVGEVIDPNRPSAVRKKLFGLF